MVVVFDVQGYMTPDFVPKELSISNGQRIGHYLFKPPFPYQTLSQNLKRQCSWVLEKYHGIPWNSGWVDLQNIQQIINEAIQGETVVFCKGSMKKEFMERYTNLQVIDLEPNTFALHNVVERPLCYHHTLERCHCSLYNIKFICNYLKINNLD